MSNRSFRRAAARDLRKLKVPFILRHTLAKAQAKFVERHSDVLKRKGWQMVQYFGCECCDPQSTQIWEGECQGNKYRITTDWGAVVSCERVNTQGGVCSE